MLGTIGRYLAVLVVLVLLEASGRLGLSVHHFVTEAEDRAQTSAHQLAADVRDIMINRGGPVAARTVYPILERIYEDAGFRIAIEPSEETVAGIEEAFGFTPQGAPPDWPEGWFRQGRVGLVADEFCLQCHVRSEVGSVLGTVTVRRYFASELGTFWRDTRILGIVAMINVILATGIMFFLLRRRIRPLLAIDEAIGDLGKAAVALTRRVPVQSRDEFGRLAHDINLFLDRISGAAADLKAFTRELRQFAERLAAARQKIEKNQRTESLADLRTLEEAAKRSASQAEATWERLMGRGEGK